LKNPVPNCENAFIIALCEYLVAGFKAPAILRTGRLFSHRRAGRFIIGRYLQAERSDVAWDRDVWIMLRMALGMRFLLDICAYIR